MLIFCTRGAQSPIAWASGLSSPVSCSRGVLPSENPHVCRKRDSYGGLPLFLLPSPAMALCFSCKPRPPPRIPQLWDSAPKPVAHCSLGQEAISSQPTLVFSPELTSRALVSGPSPRPSISGFGVQGGGADDLCSSQSALPSSVQLLQFSWWLWGPSISADIPIG